MMVLPTSGIGVSATPCDDLIVQSVAVARPAVVKIEAKSPLSERLGPIGSILASQSASGSEESLYYTSVGSGVIWDRNGYVVTTASVVKNSQKFTVTSRKKRTYEAQLIGVDEETNLAVLKIDAGGDDLPVLSHYPGILKEGSRIILLGYGYGGVPSISEGIAGMPPEECDPGRQTIQFTATLRPGNSGGALIDSEGHLLGIVLGREDEAGMPAILKMMTQKSQRDPLNDRFQQQTWQSGYGIAVPVNVVEWIVSSLIKNGHVVRGWIGLSVQKTDCREPSETCLRIVRVLTDSPAARAGIQTGDLIARVDDQAIESPTQFGRMISNKNPGAVVTLGCIRGETSMKVPVEITSRPSINAIRSRSKTGKPISPADSGLVLQDLTPALRQYNGLPPDSGILVFDIEASSIAAGSGILAGDIILEINAAPVRSVKDFNYLIASAAESGTVNMTIFRKDHKEEISLDLFREQQDSSQLSK